MTANPQTCPKCGSPVLPGMKFCESCGAKIEALPVCAQCGAAIAPDVKFCETCGTPVRPAVSPAVPVPAIAVPAAPPVAKEPETPPAPVVQPPAAPPVKVEEKTIPVPEAKPVPPAPAAKAEEKTAPVMAETPAPAPVKEAPRPEKAKEVPKESGPKKPMSSQTMIIAGVIVLALLGAAVYFVVLPMLSGSGTPSQALPVSTVPAASGSTPGTPAAATGSTSAAGSFSLTPGPTQVPPSNRVVILDAERDPISSLITVTFKGGAGQYGVREVIVTLTRSDGGVETKSFKPDAIGSGVTLQGTAKTDRVEATTYFYTGEQYKVMDQIFEYKKRGG